MFKIFEDLTIEDVPEVVISEIIKELNSDPTSYNNTFLYILNSMDSAINEAKKGKVLANSSIDVILTFVISAKTIMEVIKHYGAAIKVAHSEIESIKLNCSSIINAFEIIKELQAKNLKNLDPEELLTVLTT